MCVYIIAVQNKKLYMCYLPWCRTPGIATIRCPNMPVLLEIRQLTSIYMSSLFSEFISLLLNVLK